jgi:excisionase family DNA binding protein
MIDNEQSTLDQKKTYTIDEIATILNICMKSAYALVKSGAFHYVRAGRTIRVSKKSFDRWLNQ